MRGGGGGDILWGDDGGRVGWLGCGGGSDWTEEEECLMWAGVHTSCHLEMRPAFDRSRCRVRERTLAPTPTVESGNWTRSWRARRWVTRW